MDEDQRTLAESQKIDHYEDEIELVDILKVIWRWKYFIIVGTIVLGLSATIISFKMDKIYSIDMTLRPGTLGIGEEGKNIYIESSKDIKILIESGKFNNYILKYMKDAKINKHPKELNFKVTIPKDDEIVKIKYETSDVKQGLVILDFLSKLLIDTYKDKIQSFKNEYDLKLNLIKSEIDYNKVIIQSFKRNVKNIDKRIYELMSEIDLKKNNTAKLIEDKNKLLAKNQKEINNPLILFYSDTIQNNLELLNDYKNDINQYEIKKEEEFQKIEEAENEIDKNSYEIQILLFKIDKIQNIQILQPPNSSRYPIKPKVKLNIIFALLAGLFLMMFLAPLLEYLSKHNKK